MHGRLVVLALMLAGCSGSPPTEGVAFDDPVEVEASRRHNLTFGEPLVGTQTVTGQFAPYEAQAIGAPGISAGGVHEHAIDLPPDRALFVTAVLSQPGQPVAVPGQNLTVNFLAPLGVIYSDACCLRGGTGAEAHVMVSGSEELRVQVHQVVPAADVGREYEVHVEWAASSEQLPSGAPVEVELQANDTVLLQRDGDPLHPVFVFGPDGDLLRRLEGLDEVTYQVEEGQGGRYAFLHSGHGVAARYSVESFRVPSWRILGLEATDSAPRILSPAPSAEQQWPDEAATAPVRVIACATTLVLSNNAVLRVDFPGGGSIDSGTTDTRLIRSGHCVATPMGDDRLYAGTYTTTYSHEGGGETRVWTHLVHMER